MYFKQETGKYGEFLAYNYLIKNNFKILDKNFTCKRGEIDIIAFSPYQELVFIEVKTTFRTTAPNPDFQIAIDLTRNEWVAACQQREHFYIYRLFFTNSGTFLYILKNPYQKNEDGVVYVAPTSYRIEYRLNVSDEREAFLEHESA